MTLLTVPEIQTTKQQTYRYYCELAHRETYWEGVTPYTKMIDVAVVDPTREATIADLIVGCEWKELVSAVLSSRGPSMFFTCELDKGGEE